MVTSDSAFVDPTESDRDPRRGPDDPHALAQIEWETAMTAVCTHVVVCPPWSASPLLAQTVAVKDKPCVIIANPRSPFRRMLSVLIGHRTNIAFVDDLRAVEPHVAVFAGVKTDRD